MMARTALIGAAWLMAAPALAQDAAPDAASMLITPQEASVSAAAFAAEPNGPTTVTKQFLPTGADPLAPALEVLAPHTEAPIVPPFDVAVTAHPQGGASISRQSLRIKYGFFRFDVTDRMMKLGKWDGNTFLISHTDAPAGTHLFYVSLSDNAGHAASTTVKVVVKKP